ncbi:sensor histidine kinase [Microbacterium sp. MYb62]|uniref:sensor histidine kinase n=1 Tax=Microbacterium sp. MYb62 TaxID=1848690 RepID=UPI000CFDB6BB|nr:histidine kinase [Microbacterium sp. MYb62]PRB16513.1 hypothetical protein CQ042_06570 [Microbacterium sp. MYb62]
MRKWFANGGSLAGDLVIAATAFALASAVIAGARAVGWYPISPENYLLISLIGAVAWPLSRKFPRGTLVLVVAWYAWPDGWGDILELRLLPLVLIAGRAAARGTSIVFVGVLTVTGLAFALVPWELSALLEATIRGRLDEYYDFIVPDPSRRILAALVVIAVVALSRALYLHRTTAEILRQRNEQLVELRAADRERVADQVRASIARDIHDVVAHHVTAMVIGAQAADRVADSDPTQLRSSVRTIANEGSEALAAMRRVVRMLRDRERPDAPVSLFADSVRTLADRVRAIGIDVDLQIEEFLLPEFVQAGALRIVQEALTNVMRHSGARRAVVQAHLVGDELHLLIRDDGTEPPAHTQENGFGLIGMHERALALQGTLTAGPHVDGGWEVRAALPLSDQWISL